MRPSEERPWRIKQILWVVAVMVILPLGACGELQTGSMVQLARDYMKQGQPEKAIPILTDALEMAPDDIKYKIYGLRANAYTDQKNYEDALADNQSMLDLNPDLALAHKQRANILRLQHDYQQAISESNKAISLDESDPETYWMRGLCYYKTGDYQAASQDCTKCIDLGGKYPKAYLCRAAAYEKFGRKAEAEKDRSAASSLSDDQPKLEDLP